MDNNSIDQRISVNNMNNGKFIIIVMINEYQ